MYVLLDISSIHISVHIWRFIVVMKHTILYFNIRNNWWYLSDNVTEMKI